MLDIARIQVRRYELKSADIEIAALVHDCCAEAAGTIGSGRITVDIAPDLGVVHADEAAMRRISLTILNNACRAEPAHGTVSVTADAVKDGVEIAVHGNGAMLDETDIAILIRPFEKATEEAASTRAQSFGFGLEVASALAVEIGGILSVMCPSEGGMRVALRMPRAEPQ